ncbi:anti-sigma factor [Conexibacter sp. JD483]|uniref:anti-sigma factor domain-containing protein n=1 Tax=unclassified Conexibacter TaxID=2627773 RepID=UPI00271C10B3|nr:MULTISPECIES: anti-sigma factor [unclassified Conexibacter]MDO8188509.1 anti-sigma factor [Conexibacter sp. CPCC 205706]MDO8200147.1 anti-sigma factor [Conexibacter sp. CPCC 205762]MDR9371186.1 anti-sigma factor [Conexibacter sp. JD483]
MTDDRSPTPDADLSSYLLGELDAGARARFEHRLAEDADLRAQVERLAPVVTRLYELPEQAWEVLPPSSQPSKAGSHAALRSGRRAWLPSLPARRWVAGGLAAVALLVAGAGAGALLERGRDSSVTRGPEVALAPFGRAPAGASANARMVAPNRMRLSVEDLPPSPAGSYYEAWLLDGPGRVVPVAAFSVGPDRRAVVEVPLPAAADRYRFLDISLQHVGAGTAHSGDSLLRGALS